MLPVLTTKDSRVFDNFLIKKIGLSPLVLMENAARGALDAISEILDTLNGKAVLIFCGKGNNGGDGYALARLLYEQSVDVYVFSIGKPSEMSEEAAHQYAILKNLLPSDRLHSYPLRDSHFLAHIQVGLIVDALLGTGTEGVLRGKYKEAVIDIDAFDTHFDAQVLSLDVPTGLNSDTGAVDTMHEDAPVVVFADYTVAMGSLKQGFFLQNAPDIVGEVSVADLGAPISKWNTSDDERVYLIDEDDAAAVFQKRNAVSSKFDYGHVLSISGSKGLTGAAILAGLSALKAGCGLVSVAVPDSQRAIVAQGAPELMTFAIREDANGQPTSDAFDQLEHILAKATVVHFGSGVLLTTETKLLAVEVVNEVAQPLVLDAGGVIALTKHHSLLRKRQSPVVITPHSGEFAQLLGVDREVVERDRIGTSRNFAMKNNCVVVLKGAPTIIASPDGTIFINPTGNPGMATAGAGDTLAGMIAGVIAQKPDDVLEAVMYAVYLHGLAGDIAAETITEQGVTASDVINSIPKAIMKLRNQTG